MTVTLISLIAFAILASIIAVEAKDLLSTVISVAAGGLALSVIFLFMRAPDLAITQVVVEVLCIVFLIRGIVLRVDTTFEARADRFVVAAGLLGVAILVAAVFSTVTIATMLSIVLVGSFGISFLPIKRLERYTHALAGATICLCGLAIQFLGL